MYFKKANQDVQAAFDDNDFTSLYHNKSKHTHKIDKCTNGTKITLTFPGYKTYITQYGKMIFDYRVNTVKGDRTFALSHVNIVMDIYNKIINGGADPHLLKELIVMAMEEGFTCFEGYVDVLRYTPVNCPPSLIAEVHDIHKRIPVKRGDKPKKYNEPGNAEDLTTEELFVSMLYIALQEDINYPIARDNDGEIVRFGRIMPLMRYIEIIEVCLYGNHTLEEVIIRTLAHYKPDLWSELDYSFINEIK